MTDARPYTMNPASTVAVLWRRSCRARLNLHNDRRRKRVPDANTPRQDLANPQPRGRRTRTRRKRMPYGEQAGEEELEALDGTPSPVHHQILRIPTFFLPASSHHACQCTFISGLCVGYATSLQCSELHELLITAGTSLLFMWQHCPVSADAFMGDMSSMLTSERTRVGAGRG